ncbi:MAG: hypothetical protein IPL55_12890 [Saprospiraceae bacterium]|nr:hypothetical protein [Saprospiraceae bacterium]
MNTINIAKAIINEQIFIALNIAKDSPEYDLIKQVKGRKWRSMPNCGWYPMKLITEVFQNRVWKLPDYDIRNQPKDPDSKTGK